MKVGENTIWHFQLGGKGKTGIAFCGIKTFGVPHIKDLKKWAQECMDKGVELKVCHECLYEFAIMSLTKGECND